MRMRNPSYKDDVINNCPFFYSKDEGFLNDNPICLEIGMGKGDFLISMALKYPNLNFVGVEKYSSVAAVAIKKMMNYNLPNLKVLIIDASNLSDIFNHNIAKIYLNFSDPWPKKRHSKRRLTSPVFLQVYDQLFDNKPHIIMKTDNDLLFGYSLESLKNSGYQFNVISYDLHSEQIENELTEYEKKFMEKGIKIKYLDATKEL